MLPFTDDVGSGLRSSLPGRTLAFQYPGVPIRSIPLHSTGGHQMCGLADEQGFNASRIGAESLALVNPRAARLSVALLASVFQ